MSAILPKQHYLSPNCSNAKPKRITIFGSTGSIGKSALEVIRCNPDEFEVVALVAGSNFDLLARQIEEFKPKFGILADSTKFLNLKDQLSSSDTATELLSGEDGVLFAATLPNIDLMLAAIVGLAGFRSVYKAMEVGTHIALANKESLVMGGAALSSLSEKTGAKIVPVDSEHSAIFQVLRGERREELKSITLTASGGPFFKMPLSEFKTISREQALKHPRWSMGPKVTIDSATLMNKALELIEAYWLFGVPVENLRVLIHPQSIVHSLVEFLDGSQLAQLSVPDMQGAISYALGYPDHRLASNMKGLNLAEARNLEFYEVDSQKFAALDLAREVLRSEKPYAAAIFSIANEVAVERFLDGKLEFNGITAFVRGALERFGSFVSDGDLFQVFAELVKEIRAGDKSS